MHSNIFLRVCSSAVMVPLVWAVVWFGKSVYEDYSIPLFKLFLAFLGLGLAWEWENMFHKKLTTSGMWLFFTTILTVFLAEDNLSFTLWLWIFLAKSSLGNGGICNGGFRKKALLPFSR